jgi:hypothetical protein
MKMSAKKKTNRGSKKAAKTSKPELIPDNSTNGLTTLLGHGSGIVATILLVSSISLFLMHSGIITTPAFFSLYPAEFGQSLTIKASSLDNGEVKMNAWRISRENGLATTLSLSEEETTSLLKKHASPIERVRFEEGILHLAGKSRYGKLQYSFSCSLQEKKGQFKLLKLHLGQVAIPSIFLSIVGKNLGDRFTHELLHEVKMGLGIHNEKTLSLHSGEGELIVSDHWLG